jgi:hypothetical protein
MSLYESKFKSRMQALGVTSDFMAAVSEIAPTRFSLAFRGTKDFDGDQIRTIDKWLTDLEELKTACEPVPVAFSNAKVIKGVIEARRSSDLWIDIRVSSVAWAKQKTDEDNSVSEL